MSESITQDLRERLVKVGRDIYTHGFVPGTVGNISAKIPSTDTILIKPSGVSMGALNARARKVSTLLYDTVLNPRILETSARLPEAKTFEE